MTDLLQQTIRNVVSLSVDDIEFTLSLFKPCILNKEEYLLKVGEKCNQVAFIKSGMLRMCYPNDKGEETTCHFSFPGEFVTSFTSFATQNPSTESIQAIQPTELLLISKQDLEMLYQKIPATQELGKKCVENIIMLLEKRMAMFLNASANERYQFLLKHNPILIQTVPLQYLASYLGITPQHLSRLRKNN